MSAQRARRYYEKGMAELKDRNLEEARQDFMSALELCPHFFEARLGYSAATLQQGDAQRAVNILRGRLLESTERYERAHLFRALAEALMHSKDLRGAEAALEEAISCGADAGLLHDQLGRLRGKTGRFEEAFDQLLLAARAGQRSS